MIDLHCHLLPEVDDGARSMEDALFLARAAVEQGIKAAVLTPHIHPGVFDNRHSSLRPVFERYRQALAEAGIPLAVYLGAEVHLHPDMFSLWERYELPIIGWWEGQPLVLLEFPDGSLPPGSEMACRMSEERGFRWIIAHPERNKAVMRDPERILPFVDAGCLLQLTAASVTGAFGSAAARTAHLLLSWGVVDVVASDAHNLAHRPPVMQEARAFLTQRYGPAVAYRLTEDMPLRLIRERSDFEPLAGVSGGLASPDPASSSPRQPGDFSGGRPARG
ncbi:MAG: hypothetical protein Q4D91_08580 [Lautropia sp.]|nr:hypothetical protein [Lautropia sp.]